MSSDAQTDAQIREGMKALRYIALIDELVRLSDEAIADDISENLALRLQPGKEERMARHVALRQAARIIRCVMPKD